MPERLIELRSDTMTRPTPEMRAAMAAAEVGDDVFDEDPTVHRLQERVAQMLGKEAAIFVPSGTMSNQIGVRLHCSPGDEFICEAGCHIYNYEQGAYAQFGVMRLDQLVDLPRGGDDHVVRTRLVCLENTHNRGSGRILPYDGVMEICNWAHVRGLATHLDGARLFNAVVATGIPAATWAEQFDTVSVCFSKGLGAPIGSALAGPSELIKQARRHRKLFGGGMRQAGVIAAAALYALDHHVDRLADDHAKARVLAAAVCAAPNLRLLPDQIDTNIVIFEIGPPVATAQQFVAALAERGVNTLAISRKRVRMVTHLDVSRPECEQAAETLVELARHFADGVPSVRSDGAVYA
jgi:threonine aldolase